MNATAFLPRSSSKAVFVISLTCYALAVSTLLRTILRAFGAPDAPITTLTLRGYPAVAIASHLLLAPLVESLLLIALIELLRWLRSPVWLQAAIPAAALSLLHLLISSSVALVLAPGWLLMAAAYLRWRPVSTKTAFIIVASIHALLNLNGAIWTIGYAVHRT